jgi:hypothetical protein
MAEFGARFGPGQPNCNPKWPGMRRRLCKVPPSVQQPNGDWSDGGGRPRWESGEGERILISGEHHGEGAAKRCAGLASSSVGAIRGEPMTQAGALFAPSPDPFQPIVDLVDIVARACHLGGNAGVRRSEGVHAPSWWPDRHLRSHRGSASSGPNPQKLGIQVTNPRIHQGLREPTRCHIFTRIATFPSTVAN